MEARRKVMEHLRQMGLNPRLDEHPAVFTMEGMAEQGLDRLGTTVKNLFLRDAKGRRHFLVMMRPEKKVDLKSLQAKIGSTALRFASAERLARYLGLETGAVGPFGVLNDEERAVEVVFDRDLAGETSLGVHPNDNTATVWLSFADLERLIQERGNPLRRLEI